MVKISPKDVSMKTVSALLKARQRLKGKVACSLQEAESLLASVLKVSTLKVYFKERLNQKQTQRFFVKVRKRLKGYPLEYITREKYFYRQRFFLHPGVFIPRVESERLVSAALKAEPLKGLDFGAGSGCLAISILLARPACRFVAVDISGPALKTLQKNRQQYGLKDRLKILNQDVESLKSRKIVSFLRGRPDVIISNPPYVANKSKELSAEVRLFEPPLALFSSQKGMGHIYSWFDKAMDLLAPEGGYVFEFGFDQKDRVEAFLESRKIHYRIYKDLCGRYRVAYCVKK